MLACSFHSFNNRWSTLIEDLLELRLFSLSERETHFEFSMWFALVVVVDLSEASVESEVEDKYSD